MNETDQELLKQVAQTLLTANEELADAFAGLLESEEPETLADVLFRFLTEG